MAAVAVRERMDRDETVMKAHGDFVGRKRFVFYPGFNVIEQMAQGGLDLVKGNPEIPLAAPEIPGPPPDLAEHLLVQISDELFVQQIGLASTQSPVLPAQDIFLLGLVQFAPV